ncbi:SpoIIE family protein phosphatase [Streptomyces sp. KR80]|uniref:SpoIIE family protein phosphatase n=1 Tax=Streptomyces sp. KR80 TaxID=3457426 RepID=UPI003FD43032
MAGDPVAGSVRDLILSSWQRCQSLGLQPEHIDVPYRDAFDQDSDLVRAAGPVLDRLQTLITGTPVGVILTDTRGWILERRVGEPEMARVCDSTHGFPGFCLTESFAGTNAINLALRERRPCRVYGPEHFDQRLQTADCLAVPVRAPLNGRIVGVLNAAYPAADVSQGPDALMYKAALAVEERLLEQSSEHERALLRAYLQAGHRARLPDVPLPTDAADLDVLPGGMLGREDQLILQESAAALIASGGAATVEVPLSRGRVATLLARSVAEAMEGVVVEVLLSEGSLQSRLTVVTPSTDHPETAPQPPPTAAAAAARKADRFLQGVDLLRQNVNHYPQNVPSQPAPEAHTGAHAEIAEPRLRGWPLMIGEPGVGKFAVAARRRLELLTEVGARIGTTLDVTRTAEELTEATVPSFADYVTIDLYDSVLRGDEPAPASTMRRTALHGIREGCPFHSVGEQVDFAPGTSQARCLANGWPVLEPDLESADGWQAHTAERTGKILEQGVHSLIAVPLRARGVALGVASFYRAEQPAPFEDDDVSLAEELVARAAVCIDNARRYTRERTMALALQHSLLPGGLPEQRALEVAHRYVPARSGVGGDWFDVIPLSGARVALVVGDVVGHGIHAAVTMGRLRTAVHNFSAFDVSPDELLAHLDNLVDRMDQEASGGGGDAVIGASCLCAIYDPTSRRCTLARAGHLPPALVHPDGTVSFLELPAGPPLGLGGMPFESAEFDLPEGSQLVLYTDGLVEDRTSGIDTGLEQLRRALAHADRSSGDTCEAVIASLPPARPCDDDLILLVARTHAVDPDNIARWDHLPADPAIVPAIRAAVTRQLDAWQLENAVFTTELILSELVANAIRHAVGPIQVRLIRDLTLICEVSDRSSTAPHLRQAAATDEGGRGLFLVAQLAHRWGTRYTPHGKTIWAEQPLAARSR